MVLSSINGSELRAEQAQWYDPPFQSIPVSANPGELPVTLEYLNGSSNNQTEKERTQHMKYEEARLLTYTKWPKREIVSPVELATLLHRSGRQRKMCIL